MNVLGLTNIMVGLGTSTSDIAFTVNRLHFVSWLPRVFLPQNGFAHVRHRRWAPGSRVRDTAAQIGTGAVQCVRAWRIAALLDAVNPHSMHVTFFIPSITLVRRQRQVGCEWKPVRQFSSSTESACS